MTVRDSLTTVNFTPKTSRKILGLVLHSQWGTQQGSIAWFKNPQAQASAHYCIGQDGEIVRIVPDMSIAWHAGLFDEPIADWLHPNPNNVTIGIELEDRRDPHWSYPQAQRDALVWLVKDLCTKYNISQDKDHVLLHKNLNPSRRSDPVGMFDINWVIDQATVPPPVNTLSDDQTRALKAVEGFKTSEGHSNLEGAVNALLGDHKDLQTYKQANTQLIEQSKELETTLAKMKDDRTQLAALLGSSDDPAVIYAKVNTLVNREDPTPDPLSTFLSKLVSLWRGVKK